MRVLIVALLGFLLIGCSGDSNEPAATAKLDGKTLAHKYLIVDTHIDVPFRLYRNWEDVGEATERGQFDYPRAIEGGLNVPFMSIYIPASVDEDGGAKALADDLIDLVEGIVQDHPDKFTIVREIWQIKNLWGTDKIMLALGMENGGPLEGDLANLEHFYNRGVRYITLTHSKSNHISDSSYDENKQWGGLSEFGKQLIPAMNAIGMMVDVSHISDEAFYQVIELSKAPVIASHSSARAFVPGFERNMSDDMLVKLAENGGVMQLNIGSTFISKESRESAEARTLKVKAYLEANGLEAGSIEAREAMLKIYAETPVEFATLDDVLDHVDHVVKVAGIDHIGIGSDFDGVGDSLPVGFKDVSDYPNFIDGLIARGYSEADIEKILGGNLLRAWAQITRISEAGKPLKLTR